MFVFGPGLCLSYVCLMSVLCLSYVCVISISCLSYVSLLFLFCLSYVCLMSHVCLMLVLCCHISVLCLHYVCLIVCLLYVFCLRSAYILSVFCYLLWAVVCCTLPIPLEIYQFSFPNATSSIIPSFIQNAWCLVVMFLFNNTRLIIIKTICPSAALLDLYFVLVIHHFVLSAWCSHECFVLRFVRRFKKQKVLKTGRASPDSLNCAMSNVISSGG